MYPQEEKPVQGVQSMPQAEAEIAAEEGRAQPCSS